ncbi:mitogen-activated protein kinase 15 [Actinidia eriantha]|uniref:mitogen-activated protein kinase 15 n=1 Tax=Actinidia eriantha TaxID=165200 RepID=UPI002585E4FB|nr:mitogen-activated protein kinase 15 [Actinidia eriantha]
MCFQYTPAIDIWSIGCIFAEMLTGKPLFPGKNLAHELDLITDVLGSPSAESIARIRNEKARRYLSSMKMKPPVPFSQRLLNADPLALRLLERLLAFDPRDRPSVEEIRISKANYTIWSLFLKFVLFIFTGLDRSILQ